MKVFKPIGSKDRLVEIFQKVNKVKLNEGLYEAGSPNLNADNVLNMAFDQLKNNSLNIEHSGTQATGEENFVELLCTDRQGNNITFVFKIQSTEGDQEGVFNINNVTLNSFSFESARGDETIDLAEDGLNAFNQQHADELIDVVSNYADIEEPAENDVQEAIELIDAIKQDSYPFGGSPKDMQTGSGYADQKPTNDAVRVKAPELDSFIQEDMNSMIQNLPGPSGADYLYPQAKELGVSNQYILRRSLWKEIGVELLDIIPAEKKDLFWLIFRFEGKKYKGLINKNYGNAMKVVNGVKKRLDADSMLPIQETDKPAMKLIQPAIGGSTAGGVKQLEEKMNLPIVGGVGMGVSEVQMVGGTETLGEPKPINPSTKSPVDDLPPEKKKIIMDAINNLTVKRGRREYAPTAKEINDEIVRMRSTVQEDTLSEGVDYQKKFGKVINTTNQLIQQANADEITAIEPDSTWETMYVFDRVELIGNKLKAFYKRNSGRGWENRTDDVNLAQDSILNFDEAKHLLSWVRRSIKKGYGDQRKMDARDSADMMKENELEDTEGEMKRFYKEKELASQHPEQMSTMELEPEEEPIPEVSPQKRDIILQASENLMARNARNPNYSPTINEILDEIDRMEGKKPAEKVRGASKEGEFYLTEEDEKGEYPDPIGKKFKPKKHYPKKKKKTDTTVKLGEGEVNTEDEVEPPKEYDEPNMDMFANGVPDEMKSQDDGMSLEPKGDEVEQIAQDKEQAGDEISGGKADGKSPLEYDPDQIAMGVKIELEHTDDPMKAVEIAMDHLEEFPDYYTRLAKMEKDAKGELGGGEESSKEKPEDDKELTDMLLGYKSHNVGDEVEVDDDEEETEKVDESTTVSDQKDRFQSIVNTPRPETPMVQEDLGFSERDLKNTDPATWHQIQIAKKTLKMPAAMANVMGGMSKEEAKEILRSRGIKFQDDDLTETFREGQASHFDSLLKQWAKRYGVQYEWKFKDVDKFGKKETKSYFVLSLGYDDYRYLPDPARLELNKLMGQFNVKFQYPHGTWSPIIA